MMPRVHLLAPTLALTVLAVAGCGGSSKSGSTATAASAPAAATTTAAAAPSPTAPAAKIATGKPLTRAGLVASADAICARTNRKLTSFTVVKTQTEFARVLPQTAAYDATELSELDKLVPPASMTHTWAQILRDFQLYSEYVSRVTQYAQANNLKSAAPIIESSSALRQKLNILAAYNGFKHCSTQQ